ncbi:hypothetical protein EAF04_008209 [Stromatinia cepivora]|nr:hypothetical protein EAF04_008209 [Stromatinia cepivora]
MPSKAEKNKFEIIDVIDLPSILVKIDQAKDKIRKNTLQIKQIIASGVITQEEDHKVELFTRLIMCDEGLLECYNCYLPSLYTEGLSEEEKIETQRKAYMLHKAAFACLTGKTTYVQLDLTLQIILKIAICKHE